MENKWMLGRLVFLSATAGLGTSKVCVAYQTGKQVCVCTEERTGCDTASPLASVGKTGTYGTYRP